MGLIGLLLQWGILFSRFNPGTILITGALSLLLAATGASLLHLIESFAVACFALLVLAILGVLPLLVDATKVARTRRLNPVDNTKDPVERSNAAPTLSLPQAFRLGWGALFGLAFNFFTIGLTFWPVTAGLSPSTNLLIKPSAYLIIALVAAVILWRSFRSGGKVLDLFCRAALPVAAAIMLATPFIDNIFPLDAIPSIASLPFLGIGLFNLIGLYTLLVLARSYRSGIERLLAGGLIVSFISMGAGIVVFRALERGAQIVSLCILSLFLVLLVLTALAEAYRRQDGQSGDSPGEPPQEIPDRFSNVTYTAVAEQYGLSPRETEILAYLARGRGSKRTGDELCISPDTVRTHYKRIYEKMSIHTKEELLDILENQR
jgi:DNA-binding CsgD family transcriptional regulator